MNKNNLVSNCDELKNKLKSEESKFNTAKFKEYIKSMSAETKLKFWIKTLISEQSTLPEIIKTVDKIIEIQASSVSFSTDIFNKNGSTINQVEKVIDLSERKKSLINIYIMIQKMLKNLSADDYDFIERKFIYNWSNDELSDYYSVSIRTVYRRIDKLIKLIYEECLKNKWTLTFIESQTKEEGWLKEKYFKCVNDYFKNTNYKFEDNFNKNQSKSSSESYLE